MTDEIAAAKAVMVSHERLSRAGDTAGILANMAHDIALVVPNTPLVEGKPACEEVYARLFSMGKWDFEHEYSGAELVGDAVILYGVARGTFTPNKGDRSPIENNFLTVLKRSGESYKIWRGGFGPAS